MSERAGFKSAALLDKSLIERFKEHLSGGVVLPNDPSYESARWSWNRAIDRHPGMVVRCACAEDVVRVVDFARDNDLLAAVRAGGHSFAGHSTCNGGVVIDLSAMKRIQIDPLRRIARAQAGLKVGEFDRATQALGLATVMGGCEDVGIAGFTLGGGQGLLSSRYGLGCDNLLSLEVVTADGSLVRANANENSDLFWGMRGGAGNFGIATALEYRLHAVSTVFGGFVVYPITQARETLSAWLDYTLQMPEEVTTVFGAAVGPEGPVIGILSCYCGDNLAAADKALSSITAVGSVLSNSMKAMSYLEFQHAIEEFNPTEVSAHRKSNFFREFPAEAIDVMVDYLNRAPAGFFVGLFPYRGAICRLAPGETAFPLREPGYDLWIDSYWQQPPEAESSVEWANAYWSALRPFTTGAVYVNNLSDEGEARAQAAYGVNYDRLVALKNKYDPTNFFRMNQNIKPTVR